MNHRDLFEYADLDLLGLLDEQERAEFEEAFRAAPPHIQAQVRAAQTRLTRDDGLLPAVEAPAGLRTKVLAAVRDAIASVNHEPVARIGPGAKSWSSAPIWRAACLGFMTASLVLGGASWHFSRMLQNVSDTAMSNGNTDALVRKSGPKFVDMLARDSMRHIAFESAAPEVDSKAQAGLYFDTETRSAYLVCTGLPIASDSYQLVIENGTTPISVKNFQASAGTFFVVLDQVDVDQVKKMQILAPQADGSRPAPILVASSV